MRVDVSGYGVPSDPPRFSVYSDGTVIVSSKADPGRSPTMTTYRISAVEVARLAAEGEAAGVGTPVGLGQTDHSDPLVTRFSLYRAGVAVTSTVPDLFAEEFVVPGYPPGVPHTPELMGHIPAPPAEQARVAAARKPFITWYEDLLAVDRRYGPGTAYRHTAAALVAHLDGTPGSSKSPAWTGRPLAEGADVVTGSGACTVVRGGEMTSLMERRQAVGEERIRATSEGRSWVVDVVPLLPGDGCTTVLDEGP